MIFVCKKCGMSKYLPGGTLDYCWECGDHNPMDPPDPFVYEGKWFTLRKGIGIDRICSLPFPPVTHGHEYSARCDDGKVTIGVTTNYSIELLESDFHEMFEETKCGCEKHDENGCEEPDVPEETEVTEFACGDMVAFTDSQELYRTGIINKIHCTGFPGSCVSQDSATVIHSKSSKVWRIGINELRKIGTSNIDEPSPPNLVKGMFCVWGDGGIVELLVEQHKDRMTKWHVKVISQRGEKQRVSNPAGSTRIAGIGSLIPWGDAVQVGDRVKHISRTEFDNGIVHSVEGNGYVHVQWDCGSKRPHVVENLEPIGIEDV